jgi:hypothetical protein
VAADLGQLDAGSQGVLAGEKGKAVFVAGLGQERDFPGLAVRGELPTGGERRRPEGVLGLGHHEPRPRELADVAGVVPVGVGDHDGVDLVRGDAQPGQRLRRGAVVRPAPAVADLGGEAGVDEDDAPAVPDHPEVVVDVQVGVRLAVQVEVEVALRPRGDPVPVLDGEHLPRQDRRVHSPSKASR